MLERDVIESLTGLSEADRKYAANCDLAASGKEKMVFIY